MEIYYHKSPADRTYANNSTLYLTAEFLCWIEILRREVQFLEMGRSKATRRLQTLLANSRSAFSTDEYGVDEIGLAFRLFRAEQRALGEIMLTEKGEPACIGYAEFVERLNTKPEFAKWFGKLSNDIALIASVPDGYEHRLIAIHDSLINIMEFLDSENVRIPLDRKRILNVLDG